MLTILTGMIDRNEPPQTDSTNRVENCSLRIPALISKHAHNLW